MGYYENRKAESVKRYEALPANVRQKLETDIPRKEVTQEHSVSWISTFTKVVDESKDFAKKWNKTIKDVTMEHSYTEDYGSYSSEVHLEVKGLETDEQYHARLAEHYEATRTREEYERKEYERLSAKFSK